MITTLSIPIYISTRRESSNCEFVYLACWHALQDVSKRCKKPEVWMRIFQMPLLLIGSWPLGTDNGFFFKWGYCSLTPCETIILIIVGWSFDAGGKANFGDAMQSTALYMGDLPNWTYQVKGYLASIHLKAKGLRKWALWQIFLLLCDMNIAHLTTPTESADSKDRIKGKAASHFATDVLVAPLSDRPHVTKTLKVFMVVFAS